MPLTLSNPEAGRLARSLAALTGESVEHAVEHAIRDRLAREQAQRSARGAEPTDEAELLRDVRAIARRFREHVNRPFTSVDHDELLYDEAGLPR